MCQETQKIIDTIANSEKKTPVQAWVKGNFTKEDVQEFEYYQGVDFWILYSNWDQMEPWIKHNKNRIESLRIEVDRRNSAIPLLDLLSIEARIEPGAMIREMVSIGKQAVIMMGAVINIGASVGEHSMIDMNAVIGGRAIIGTHCHIGAGAVVAGVIEPANANPVVIKDHVLVGANAVILEGITIGEHSVVAAGAIVIEDVPPYTVVAGSPARILKKVDEKTISKTSIEPSLRNLNK